MTVELQNSFEVFTEGYNFMLTGIPIALLQTTCKNPTMLQLMTIAYRYIYILTIRDAGTGGSGGNLPNNLEAVGSPPPNFIL